MRVYIVSKHWKKDDTWAFGCIVSELVTGKLVNSRPRGDAIFAMDPDAITEAVEETNDRSMILGTIVKSRIS